MPRDLVRKNIELDKAHVDWYYETFPGGSLQGMLNQLLAQFHEVMEHTPAEYAKVAAEHLASRMKG